MMENAGDFDIIHNNYDFLPLTYSSLIKTPVITTIHGFSSPKILPVYKNIIRILIMYRSAIQTGVLILIIPPLFTMD